MAEQRYAEKQVEYEKNMVKLMDDFENLKKNHQDFFTQAFESLKMCQYRFVMLGNANLEHICDAKSTLTRPTEKATENDNGNDKSSSKIQDEIINKESDKEENLNEIEKHITDKEENFENQKNKEEEKVMKKAVKESYASEIDEDKIDTNSDKVDDPEIKNSS